MENKEENKKSKPEKMNNFIIDNNDNFDKNSFKKNNEDSKSEDKFQDFPKVTRSSNRGIVTRKKIIKLNDKV